MEIGNTRNSDEQKHEKLPFTDMNVSKNLVEELKAEKKALNPSFVHSIRLLEREINQLADPDDHKSEKIYLDPEDQRQHNLIGRLLGPKGNILKQMQADTNTKMSILGRGSVKDKKKEEELRTSGKKLYEHLNDNLHVLIESAPPYSTYKMAAGVAEVKKMLIPPEPGQQDYASRYLPLSPPRLPMDDPYNYRHYHPPPSRRPPPPPQASRSATSSTWKQDVSLSKNYNHGVSQGAIDNRYSNAGRYGNGNQGQPSANSYPTNSDSYFSSFSDDYGMSKSDGGRGQPPRRYHPYDTRRDGLGSYH